MAALFSELEMAVFLVEGYTVFHQIRDGCGTLTDDGPHGSLPTKSSPGIKRIRHMQLLRIPGISPFFLQYRGDSPLRPRRVRFISLTFRHHNHRAIFRGS